MKSRFTLLLLLVGLLTPLASSAKETKEISFKFKNADPVVFSHDLHLSKYNNNCKVCHNAIFNLKERRHYTMADMERTKSCGACHSGVKAFSVANDKDCVRCHKGRPRPVTYKPKGVAEATFSHEFHISETGGKCKSCHNGKVITGREKPVTMAEMEKGKTCGACHNGKKAFSVAGDCGRCHRGMKPREITFKSKGITDVVFSHKFHLDAYKCADCHTKVFPYKAVTGRFTMADMGQGKSCGACHNGTTAFTVAENCDKCHKGFKPGVITFKNEGGEVKFNHDFHLGMYKCADCHTKLFPFKAGVQHVGMGGMEAGKSCGTCHNGKDAFTVKENCEKCHKM
ncbi:MAG TPA: cytochrome c3 family protein [Geobacteraceae bacterium]|nr:cytochrome c3 family protein [Geobacteraceae bacterium]